MSNKFTQKGKQWEAIRKKVLARAGRKCEWSGCDAAATEVDHIQPASKGGSNNMDNLQALCRSHNARKSNRLIRSKKVTWFSPYWFQSP